MWVMLQYVFLFTRPSKMWCRYQPFLCGAGLWNRSHQIISIIKFKCSQQDLCTNDYCHILSHRAVYPLQKKNGAYAEVIWATIRIKHKTRNEASMFHSYCAMSLLSRFSAQALRTSTFFGVVSLMTLRTQLFIHANSLGELLSSLTHYMYRFSTGHYSIMFSILSISDFGVMFL